MTDASDDEFIAALDSEMGATGERAWWRLLESIGKQCTKPGQFSTSYPMRKWQEKLKLSPKKLEKFLVFCADFPQNSDGISKLLCKKTGKILEIGVPNLLKIKDEYSRKSGHSPDKLPSKSTEVRDKIQSEDKKQIPPAENRNASLEGSFELWWLEYPNKADKKKAKAAWMKLRPDENLIAIMTKAVKDQTIWRDTASKREFRPPWKNGSTWINGECWNNPVDSDDSDLDLLLR